MYIYMQWTVCRAAELYQTFLRSRAVSCRREAARSEHALRQFDHSIDIRWHLSNSFSHHMLRNVNFTGSIQPPVALRD